LCFLDINIYMEKANLIYTKIGDNLCINADSEQFADIQKIIKDNIGIDKVNLIITDPHMVIL
jgi:hypothetical protein